jgi:hypothetical protein
VGASTVSTEPATRIIVKKQTTILDGTARVALPGAQNVDLTVIPDCKQRDGNAAAEPATVAAHSPNNPTVAAKTPTTRPVRARIVLRARQHDIQVHPDPNG